VRARDAVASIRRWAQRVAYGQKLLSVTEELTAADDRRIVFRLKKPFPLLLNALALSGQPPFIMPERVARTDAFTQITDATGSGPFLFKPDEYISGDRAVYERHAGYVPRTEGTPSFLAAPSAPSWTGSSGVSSPMVAPPPRRCRPARSTGSSSRNSS